MDADNKSSKKRETKARILEALRESNGFLTMAAAKSGVSYSTVYRYTKEDEDVKQAVLEAKEKMLDFAEAKLFSKIREGDTASLIFYLKTQGKARGYVERAELAGGEDTRPIKVEVVSGEAKQLTEKLVNAIQK
jgi:hypothetical protein